MLREGNIRPSGESFHGGCLLWAVSGQSDDTFYFRLRSTLLPVLTLVTVDFSAMTEPLESTANVRVWLGSRSCGRSSGQGPCGGHHTLPPARRLRKGCREGAAGVTPEGRAGAVCSPGPGATAQGPQPHRLRPLPDAATTHRGDGMGGGCGPLTAGTERRPSEALCLDRLALSPGRGRGTRQQ